MVLAWLFFVILGSVLAVVRHADHLAEKLGEPYGTLVLTLAVTAVEAMSISAVMLHGANNPTLVRDTLMGVIMIVLNGMVGLSLLAGGWRHREQQYNLQGANAYLCVIIPLAVLGLVLPNTTQTHSGADPVGGTRDIPQHHVDLPLRRVPRHSGGTPSRIFCAGSRRFMPCRTMPKAARC